MKRIPFIALVLVLSGCVSAAKRNDVDRLLAHPEFKKAAQAAPNFTAEALNTVARLGHELQTRK